MKPNWHEVVWGVLMLLCAVLSITLIFLATESQWPNSIPIEQDR